MLEIAVFAAVKIAVLLLLAYFQAPILVWTLAVGLLLIPGAAVLGLSAQSCAVLFFLYVLIAPVLVIPAVRRRLVSDHILAIFRRILPDMTQTEKDAIDAGTVWWDADLFSGKPDWNKMLAIPVPKLSAEEQAFVDGPCEEICAMTNDWEVTHERYDLPPQVWQYAKDKGFFGMIIPKKFGGLGFSALAHSAVVMKLATRSNAFVVCRSWCRTRSARPSCCSTTAPTHQKNYYLPRLAKGLESPLLRADQSPRPGSDAASIPDSRRRLHGRCGRARRSSACASHGTSATSRSVRSRSLLGLAFRLYDPDHLIGDKDDLGITCALVPTNHARGK